MKNLKAILFDLDGTLADTMQDNFKAWQKAFEDFDITIKEKDYFPLEGMKLIKVAETISEKYNLDCSPEEIVQLKNKYYLEDHSFSFYPGVPELIDFLREKGKLLAIVTASPREKLEKTVPQDFLSKFRVIISQEDTEKGKPNSDPYLAVIKKLRVSPEECLVVENAPLGIKSAKAAGAYCIAITTTQTKSELKEADLVVSSFRKLKDTLRIKGLKEYNI